MRRAYESWHSVLRSRPRYDPRVGPRTDASRAARPPFVTEADTARGFCANHAFVAIFLSPARKIFMQNACPPQFDKLVTRVYTRCMRESAHTSDVRSRVLQALQHNDSRWASVATKSSILEIVRIGATAQLWDQRVRRSGRFGRPGDGRSTNCGSQIGFPLPAQENHRRSQRTGRNGCEPFPKAATYCHLPPFWTAKPPRAFQPLQLFSCPKWACRPAWAVRFRTTRRTKMSLGDKRSACLPGKRLRSRDPTPIV